MIGLLFPGQGSQAVGMGKDIYDGLHAARERLLEASSILGYDLKKILFEGSQEQLTDTKYAQPAIFTVSAMYLEKIKADGVRYDYAAGHSLGEYNALLAADVFDFATGLRLVRARGEAMSRMNGKGTMAAVMGLEEEELSSYLVPGAVMANLNSRNQIVISGSVEAVDAVGEKLKTREDVRFKKLNVSAAFHSPQMEEAALTMRPIIISTPFNAPSCYVISNISGKPTKDVREIKDNLISQITGQVRWCDTVLSMKSAGVEKLYEVGFGDVLRKMNKTITFRPKCYGVPL